jgi:predicted outer membrane lipoprotein
VSAREDSPRPRPDRPQDPAGTRPRHDEAQLLPAGDGPLTQPEVVDEIIAAEGVDPAVEARTERWLGERLRPEPPAAPAPAGQPVAAAPASTPHAARFQFLLGVLLACAAAAVLLLALELREEPAAERPAGPSWSSWAPRDAESAGSGAQQIADHVSDKYTGSDGRQLVYIEGGPMRIEDLPLTVAVRLPASAGGRIKVFDDKGVLYRMCGLGKDCAIAGGKPSIDRHLLLRREALELALYSFRYLDGVEQVAVLLPPPPGKRASQAVFFRKPQVGPELKKPLDATLTDRTPTVTDVTRSPDALLVQQLTIPTLFNYSLTQGNQENRAFLVLDPLNTAENQGQRQGAASPGG